MKTLLTTLDKISKKPLQIYVGDGDIADLVVSLKDGIDIKSIDKIMPQLPLAYKEFLVFSNGINFFESGDYSLYSLEEAISFQKAQEYNEKVLPIGYFMGETILLNCAEKDSDSYLYAGSSNLKNEFLALKLNIEEFLEKLLLMNCTCFWLESNSDEYFDFTE